MNDIVFSETLHNGYGQLLSVDRLIYRQKTDHQDLIIFENQVFGRVLTLDGVVQTTEGDEYVYHEMMTHVPMMAHGAVRKVLIIGGGDGGMARECLRHESLLALTMVEIDQSVVDLCKTYLPAISDGAFDDPRLNLVIADGARFVAESDDKYDLIIVDSTDPIGPGEILFGRAFYRDCVSRLAAGGVIVTQNGVPFVQGDEVTLTYRRLGDEVNDMWFYVAPVPTYQGGHMAFGWGSDNPALRQQDVATIAGRFSATGIACRYYTPEVHVAAFALPADILKLLAD
ncbi:MAG: polyamine aminopropyltransferase [Rhodospirillaceae bacterium]